MGTSFADYRGCGFWNRDAALETILLLLVVDLQPESRNDDALGVALDWWTLQATVGYSGCVSPSLDHKLADPRVRSLVIAGLRRILTGLPADGFVELADPGFSERAERVAAGVPWRCPYALATWVTEVGKALLDLVEGELPATSDDLWWVYDLGRYKLPVIRLWL